jgi:hypothetical protein
MLHAKGSVVMFFGETFQTDGALDWSESTYQGQIVSRVNETWDSYIISARRVRVDFVATR